MGNSNKKKPNAEKKTALSEYLEAKKELKYWVKKVADLAPLALYRSPSASSAPPGGGTGNPIEMAVVELETARENERIAAEKVKAAKARVMAIIQTAPEADQRVLLMRRYIDGMEWDEIAEEEGKSKTWATNLHGTAMKFITLPPVEG